MRWIFVKVTGGMSRVVGGLCEVEDGADVCGRRPVLTIGGCSSVDIAFCPDSTTAFPQLPNDESSAPPMEWMELAVEPLLWTWRELLVELCLEWKGKSWRGPCGDVGDKLSIDFRPLAFSYMFYSLHAKGDGGQGMTGREGEAVGIC